MQIVHENPPASTQKRQISRDPNLDLIRCVAVLCVVSVHFFLNTGYYTITIEGGTLVVATIIRTGYMVCVPLFCLLTGYLNSQKQFPLFSVKKLFPILTTYLLVCVMAIAALAIIRGVEYTLLDVILQILAINEGTIGYAWYVEMYIGLFLLMPFLNRIYGSLVSRQEKKLLLATFFCLTLVPNEVNAVDLIIPDFFAAFCRAAHYQKIFPNWWTDLWPVTYYFLGAYLREYEIRLPIWKNGLLLLLSIILFGLFDCYISWDGMNQWANGNAWGGLQNTVNSVLLFLLLLRLDLSRLPGWILGLIRRISVLSFGIYLCSYLSDDVVYEFFNGLGLSFQQKLPYLPLVVLASFLIAAVLSQLVEWTRWLLFWGAGQMKGISHSGNR